MKKQTFTFLTVILLLACGGNTNQQTENAITNIGQLADAIQACSYDGIPLKSPKLSSFGSVSEAEGIISKILRYTGLPQNFDVVEGDVPNAAAMIVMGDDQLPHRVIAYNTDFMNIVTKATDNNAWAGISIMAHEIGHHLCGHTIMPGGSQPPTELEADKFSGFVLYKMGASLHDAQMAMSKLVGESGSDTHPGRTDRLTAIEEGWIQACRQTANASCTGQAAEVPATETPGNPEIDDVPADTDVSLPTLDDEILVEETENLLPALNAIPNKFDRFIYDETKMLTKKGHQSLKTLLANAAKQHNIQLVVIVTNNLQGQTAEGFAYGMMKQLRVGQMDIGNGACIVVSPKTKQYDVALMNGLRFEITDERIKDEILANLGHYFEDYGKDKSINDEFLEDACKRVIDLSKHLDWAIRYKNLEEMQKVQNQEQQQENNDPTKSKIWNKMVNFNATVVSLNGGKKNTYKNEYAVPAGGKTIEVQTKDGKNILLFLHKYSEGIFATKLQVGKSYSFTARENSMSFLAFDMISYSDK